MAITIENFRRVLEEILQDAADQLRPENRDRHLRRAVAIYGSDRSRKKLHEVTGDGAAFDFSLPSDWVDGYSTIIGHIEFPVDDTVPNSALIDDNTWRLYKKLVSGTETNVLRFSFVPQSGQKARFSYTLPHVLDDDESTILQSDLDAVCYMAASLCFWALAAKFAQTTDSSIDADVIDRQRIADKYSELAKEKMAIYRSLMGMGAEGRERASGAVGVVIKEVDLRFPDGTDYLSHPALLR